MLSIAKEIIIALQAKGHQGFLVGGCVRDMLLGRTPKDFDVATDARPEQVLELFPDASKVGAHFGVVIEEGVEIATFRSDGLYGDGRRPDQVHFETSAEADSGRRDFTINAMFFDPINGVTHDFHNGILDIRYRTLRTVGNPHVRFREDFLRMLRAIRFAAKLDFKIHPLTLAAMTELSSNINSIATERVRDEISGALSFVGGPKKCLEILRSTGMLTCIFPEIAGLNSDHMALTTNVVDGVSYLSQVTPEKSLAAFFSQVDVRVVPAALLRLRVTNDVQKHILAILSMQSKISECVDEDGHLKVTMDVVKRLLRSKHYTDAIDLYGFRSMVGDPAADESTYQTLTKLAQGFTGEDLNPSPMINGNDLIELGLRPGKRFAEILTDMENRQLTGQVLTKSEALELISSGLV